MEQHWFLLSETKPAFLSVAEVNKAPSCEFPHPNIGTNFCSSDSTMSTDIFSSKYSKFLYVKLFDRIWDYDLLWLYSIPHLLAAPRLQSVGSDKSYKEFSNAVVERKVLIKWILSGKAGRAKISLYFSHLIKKILPKIGQCWTEIR